MLAYGIYQHLALSSYGFSRWSGTMPHTEITANLDWKHVAYVRNMYDVRTETVRFLIATLFAMACFFSKADKA